jgi:carbon-monoxide dehydrogenase large subunit
VYAVITGAHKAGISNTMFGLLPAPGLYDPMFHALSIDRVRHIGDPVALVIGESRRAAEDGADLVVVDYELLTAVADASQAFDPERPAIWPEHGSNVLRRKSDVYGDIDAAFASSDHVVSAQLRQSRISNQPMETRGALAEFVPETGTIRYHASHQSVHGLRWGLGLFATPVSMRDGFRQLVDDRERLRRMVRGAKNLAMSQRQAPPKPPPPDGYIPPPAQDMKPVLRQLRSQKGRMSAMARGMGGLLANGPARIPEVITKDVGGAFGSKTCISREDVAVCAAARHLQRSIKWIEDRSENLAVGGHARDESGVVELAVRDDGTILGLRVHLTLDVGAYPGIPVSGASVGEIVRVMMPGPYRIPAMQFDQVALATNKGTVVPYRGPWAVETWLRERMFDLVARELRIGRDEIRLRNIVGPEELPRPMLTGPMLDVRMSAKRTLTDALEIAEFAAWPAAQEAARAEGRVLGLGFATFIEAAPGPPGFFEYVVPGSGAMASAEPMQAVLRADGTVALHTQQVPHGQGHETTLAQVAADQLGVPYESVKLVYGDTARTPFGLFGTGGSRSAAMAGGAAMVTARELRSRITEIAADLFEASVEDIEITDGNVHVAGVPARGVSMTEIATEALRRQPDQLPGEAMRIVGEWTGGEGGWTQATHVCWVEIDLDTGAVRIPRYVVVEDCGEIINPAIVDGQIRGGVAQGIGQVLYERIGYDADANFTSGTFMDYLLPTAAEIPEIEIHHVETPSDIEANYRGVGEGGMILAPAALTNAIEDALAHLGVRITEQHLPPHRILELVGVT